MTISHGRSTKTGPLQPYWRISRSGTGGQRGSSLGVSQGNCGPSPVDLDSINEPALPQWSLIAPRAAAAEVLEAAAEIDGLLPTLSATQLAALRESKVNYNRSKHRNAHLDQIERVLQHGS